MIKKFKLTPKRLGVILLVAHVILVLIAAASEVNAIKDVYNLDDEMYGKLNVKILSDRGISVYNASSDESTYFTHLGNKGDNFSAVLCVDEARRYYYDLPNNWHFTSQKIINYGVKGYKYYTGKVSDYYGTTMKVDKVDVRPARSTRSRIEIYPYEQKTLKVTHSFTVDDGNRGYVYVKGDRAILYFPTSEIGGVCVEVNYLGVDKEIKDKGPAYVISKLVDAFYNVD